MGENQKESKSLNLKVQLTKILTPTERFLLNSEEKLENWITDIPPILEGKGIYTNLNHTWGFSDKTLSNKIEKHTKLLLDLDLLQKIIDLYKKNDCDKIEIFFKEDSPVHFFNNDVWGFLCHIHKEDL